MGGGSSRPGQPDRPHRPDRKEPREGEPRVVAAPNAGLFALGGTRSFVVGRRRVAVVDPGPDDPRHLEALAAEVGGAEEGVILLTHSHPDHAAGAPGLATLTGFQVRAGAPEPTRVRDESGARDETGAGDETGARASEGVRDHPGTRDSGAGDAARAAGPSPPLRDGDELATDAGILRVVATPGHSRDHVAFHLEESGDVLVGDLLLGEGDTTWVGEYPGCVADYLRSLERVESLAPQRLLPAHGPPIEDPAAAIGRFRAHRLERIAQVERALETWGEAKGDAVADPEALVSRLVDHVYGDALAAGLRTAASWSVRAILEYLGRAPFPPEGAPVEGGDDLSAP